MTTRFWTWNKPGFARRPTARAGRSATYMYPPRPFNPQQLTLAKSKLKPKLKTRTLTRVKKLNVKAKENRGGSESTFTLVRKIKNPVVRKLNKNLTKMFATVNNSAILTQNAGLQGVSTVTSCFGNVDLIQISNATLNQQFGGLTPTGYKTLQVLLESVECECIYTNNTNAVTRMMLFDIIPKRDIYTTSGDPSDPTVAWNVGLQHEITGATANQHQIVGAMPFDSALFTQFFTIKRITHVTLAPGQTHHHRIKFAPNKFYNMERVEVGNTAYFKGASLVHMAVQYGEPCLDNAAGVTTEATKILTVCKKHIKWTYIANDMTTTVVSNNLAGTAGLNIENVITGAAAAFAAV